MKAYILEDVILKDQVKSIRLINLIGTIILSLILALDLYWHFSTVSYPITFGTFKAGITIIVFLVSYNYVSKWTKTCTFLTILILYFSFILFPALPLNTFAAQDIFLLIFMVSVTSTLPYLCFNIKKQFVVIAIWQVLILLTTVISFYISIIKLKSQNYPGLEKTLDTNPMLYVATIISYIFIQVAIYKSKLKNYELKESIARINAELYKRFNLVESQKQELQKQKFELKEYQEELKSINNQLEITVRERTIELAERNRSLNNYGFLNSELIRKPISKLKKFIKGTQNDTSKSHYEEEYFKIQIEELENITSNISDLLNSETIETQEKTKIKILKKYHK